jgi:eukaryotic-like serine/threonine-protein kinase
MDRCLSENTLVCFAAGRAASGDRPGIERHLGQCGTCMDELAALLAYRRDDDASAAVPLRQRRAAAALVEYELIRPLGRGGMGVVYEAMQRSSGRRVALKTVHTWIEGSVHALRREVRALRTLDHPGVVRLLDDGTANGLPFFAMELIEGRSFSAVLAERQSPKERVDVTTLTLLRKVCSTLALLHQQGIVHRDLNPRNILLREPDVPVLVDFGLVGRFAGAASRDALEVAGATMGTLAYMAPEQICGALIDSRADLYALGCVLYQVLTGRLPFVESSSEALIRSHLQATPLRPSEFCPVPPLLERLTMRLLAKHPKDRLGYAEEVGSALAECGAEDWAVRSTPHRQPYLYRPQLVGRGPWLSEFRRAIERCHAGRGDRWLIAGVSGSGKTRLLGEFATLARKRGLCVITAECAADGGADAKPTALRPLLREITDRCRENWSASELLLGPYAPLLADYEPELRDILEQRPEPTPVQGSNTLARQQLFAALRHALSAMCRERPLLLVFDDMQWIDPLALDFIGSLSVDFVAQTRLLSIGAYSSEAVGPALGAQLRRVPGAQHRELDRLDSDAVAAMVREMLAIDPLPVALAQALQRQSAGNPFLVTEYVRRAVAEGWLLRTQQAEWQFVAACDNVQVQAVSQGV